MNTSPALKDFILEKVKSAGHEGIDPKEIFRAWNNSNTSQISADIFHNAFKKLIDQKQIYYNFNLGKAYAA